MAQGVDEKLDILYRVNKIELRAALMKRLSCK
jgi:hypothetical protein